MNLEKIKKYYEIVIYTYLPRQAMNEIYSHIPQLQDLVSHTLTFEDLVYNEESEDYYKDLSLLQLNRSAQLSDQDQAVGDIFVIDTSSSSQQDYGIDVGDVFLCQIPPIKSGGKWRDFYDNLNQLRDTLKAQREHRSMQGYQY